MTPPSQHLFVTELKDELSPRIDTNDALFCVDRRSRLSICVWARRLLVLLEHQGQGQQQGQWYLWPPIIPLDKGGI